MLRMRFGAGVGQPVIGADERGEQFAAVLENRRLIFAAALDHAREIADELPEARVIFHGRISMPGADLKREAIY